MTAVGSHSPWCYLTQSAHVKEDINKQMMASAGAPQVANLSACIRDRLREAVRAELRRFVLSKLDAQVTAWKASPAARESALAPRVQPPQAVPKPKPGPQPPPGDPPSRASMGNPAAKASAAHAPRQGLTTTASARITKDSISTAEASMADMALGSDAANARPMGTEKSGTSALQAARGRRTDRWGPPLTATLSTTQHGSDHLLQKSPSSPAGSRLAARPVPTSQHNGPHSRAPESVAVDATNRRSETISQTGVTSLAASDRGAIVNGPDVVRAHSPLSDMDVVMGSPGSEVVPGLGSPTHSTASHMEHQGPIRPPPSSINGMHGSQLVSAPASEVNQGGATSFEGPNPISSSPSDVLESCLPQPASTVAAAVADGDSLPEASPSRVATLQSQQQQQQGRQAASPVQQADAVVTGPNPHPSHVSLISTEPAKLADDTGTRWELPQPGSGTSGDKPDEQALRAVVRNGPVQKNALRVSSTQAQPSVENDAKLDMASLAGAPMAASSDILPVACTPMYRGRAPEAHASPGNQPAAATEDDPSAAPAEPTDELAVDEKEDSSTRVDSHADQEAAYRLVPKMNGPTVSKLEQAPTEAAAPVACKEVLTDPAAVPAEAAAGAAPLHDVGSMMHRPGSAQDAKPHQRQQQQQDQQDPATHLEMQLMDSVAQKQMDELTSGRAPPPPPPPFPPLPLPPSPHPLSTYCPFIKQLSNNIPNSEIVRS